MIKTTIQQCTFIIIVRRYGTISFPILYTSLLPLTQFWPMLHYIAFWLVWLVVTHQQIRNGSIIIRRYSFPWYRGRYISFPIILFFSISCLFPTFLFRITLYTILLTVVRSISRRFTSTRHWFFITRTTIVILFPPRCLGMGDTTRTPTSCHW